MTFVNRKMLEVYAWWYNMTDADVDDLLSLAFVATGIGGFLILVFVLMTG